MTNYSDNLIQPFSHTCAIATTNWVFVCRLPTDVFAILSFQSRTQIQITFAACHIGAIIFKRFIWIRELYYRRWSGDLVPGYWKLQHRPRSVATPDRMLSQPGGKTNHTTHNVERTFVDCVRERVEQLNNNVIHNEL